MPSKIHLAGHTLEGKVASTQEVSDVRYFTDLRSTVTVSALADGNVLLRTSKGVYTLVKHPSLNIYTGTCAGVKVHFTKKKLVAQLIYWA